MNADDDRGSAPTPRAGPALRAVVFDVDGTLAETERDGHRPAFNAAFARHGLGVEWDPVEYGALLGVTGGRHRVAQYLRANGHGPDADELAARVHRTKTELFRDHVLAGGCAARPGVIELVDGLAAAGIRIAIATTGRRRWVEPLVTGLLGADRVHVMVTGESVRRLKPDPEAYLLALRGLSLPAEEVLAVEDSAVGLRSALGAGLATAVVTNGYTAGQDFTGAAAVLPAFDRPEPLTADRCRALLERWWAERRG